MKHRIKCLLIVAAAASIVSAGAHAHGDAHHEAKEKAVAAAVEEREYGRPGDPGKVTRMVRFSMTDAMRFDPSRITVKRGDTVKFVVSNSGRLMHEMVLGTMKDLQEHSELMKKFPNMEHEEPNMVHVKPGGTEEFLWQFTRPGEFNFACLIDGHFEAGMVGKVVVKRQGETR